MDTDYRKVNLAGEEESIFFLGDQKEVSNEMNRTVRKEVSIVAAVNTARILTTSLNDKQQLCICVNSCDKYSSTQRQNNHDLFSFQANAHD